METIRMDDMDFFEMVNHVFNREREVIQNPLAPERGAAPEALPQAPAPTEVAHRAPDQKKKSVRDFEGTFKLEFVSNCTNIVKRGKGGCPCTFRK